MCLHKITKRIDQPTDKIVKAWGVFEVCCVYARVRDIEIAPQIQQGPTIRFGRWEKADNPSGNDSTGAVYYCGFHKYTSKKSARRIDCCGFLTVPVQLRKVRTVGEQDGQKVLVADEMKVMKKDAMRAFKEWKERNK